jgi:hypothetical protein
MNFIDLYGRLTSRHLSSPYSIDSLSPNELYERMDQYYANAESLYGDAASAGFWTNTWVEAIKPIRTCVNRSVEFFVSKIAPGDLSYLTVVTENESVKEAIEQVYKWSNFGSQKQLAVRKLALYGDLFMKVANGDGKVYFEIIDPVNVTAFTEDSRGYIISIRLDFSLNDNKTYTEYWNKTDGYFSAWTHGLGANASLESLGTPVDYGYLSEFGIDFVPFVHIKFRDVGTKRGASCTRHCLSKIDEANRQATRMAQMLFRYNKPLWAVSANASDAQGRPLPAPKVKSGDDLDVKDNSILYLPGQSTMQSLIPDIKYGDALAILQDMIAEIENDLPEIRYYSIKDSSMSGKAIKMILAGAIDRRNEAAGNFFDGIERLDQMALTIGQYAGVFKGLGMYENGDFDHALIVPNPFPLDVNDQAVALKDFTTAGMPLGAAMVKVGFDANSIADILAERDTEASKATNGLAESLIRFNRGEE